MKALVTTIVMLLTMGCGAPRHATDNTEVVTTYFGKEAQRSGGKYSSQHWIKTRIEQPGRFVVIFSAEWCKSCKLLERGIQQAELDAEIYWINIDEPWVQQVAALMEIKNVPLAIVMNNGKEQAIRLGSGPILVYLLSNF